MGTSVEAEERGLLLSGRLSHTPYDLLRIGAWALVIVGGRLVVMGLIRYWRATRREPAGCHAGNGPNRPRSGAEDLCAGHPSHRGRKAALGALVDGSRAAGGGGFVSMRVDEAESASDVHRVDAAD